VKDKGFIITHRSILEWEWYKEVNTCHLFRHCIYRANYQDDKWRGIEVKRGSFITSLNSLVEESGLTIQNVRTAIKNLVKTGDLTSKSHSKYRILTVINYDKYQTLNKQTNKQVTSNQQTTNKQVTTDKELKESNKVIKVTKNIYSEFVKLTDIEYKKLIDKFGSNITKDKIQTLSDYIGSSGKKYKSHYHTMLSWDNRDKKNNPKSNEPEWHDEYIKERNDKDSITELEDKKKLDSISLEEVSKRFNKL
jgi:hypothetical protein